MTEKKEIMKTIIVVAANQPRQPNEIIIGDVTKRKDV